jgi:hypothetical protein
MTTSKEIAQLAFGDPDFLGMLASGFKAIEPALSFGASFIPGVGPLISKGLDIVTGQIPDQDDSHHDTDGDED